MGSDLSTVLLSLKVACTSMVLLLPAGVYLGWLFSRKDFFGKILLNGLVNIPLVLPPVVTGYFLLVLFGPAGPLGSYLDLWFGVQIAFTWYAAVAAAAVVSLPLIVRAARAAIDTVDPRLEDTARMLKANEWSIFSSVTLPLAGNGILAGAVLAFARSFGEFGATIIVASNIPGKTQTIPLAIFTYFNQPGGETNARFLIITSIVISYVCILMNEILLRRIRDAQH